MYAERMHRRNEKDLMVSGVAGGHMQTGDHAGKYLVLKKLGSGGEGSVYLAVHTQTQQLRALKELPRAAGRASYREVKALRRMHHPGLPEIIDVLETDTSVILVMEYIRGQNLEVILKRKYRLTLHQTVDAGLQIGEALRYLHSRTPPVLHLDIKPSNIICRPDGRIVLTDFGASLRWADVHKIRMPKVDGVDPDRIISRRGTDGYAAPEMYDPQCSPDERTDLYALGAVLYYMISGVTYSAVLYKGRVPGCPETLSQIIHRCLAPAPGDRYDSAGTFLADLRRSVRRKEREKTRLLGYSAFLMSICCAALAMHAATSQITAVQEEEWNYEKMLKEASVSTYERSEELLQSAAYLEPANESAYLSLIRLYAEDSVLSSEEDTSLRTLLHTIPLGSEYTYEEMLQSNAAGYAEVCCSLGFLYRFADETEDGIRIAGGWFEKASALAVDLPSDLQPMWLEEAEIYARLCGTKEMYELETSSDPYRKAQQEWEDLTQLASAMLQDGEDERYTDEMTVRSWLWISEQALADALYLPVSERSGKIMDMAERLTEAVSLMRRIQESRTDGRDTALQQIEEHAALLRILSGSTDEKSQNIREEISSENTVVIEQGDKR